MTETAISPLRRRMIEDMTVRNFVEKMQNDYIRHVKNSTRLTCIADHALARAIVMMRWFSPVANGEALFMPNTWDETASHPARHTEQGVGRERLCATPLRCTIVRMARMPGGFPRRPDPKVMFAVHYEDGRTAYIRVDQETARHGTIVVMDVARERQDAGEIPDGAIARVKQVR